MVLGGFYRLWKNEAFSRISAAIAILGLRFISLFVSPVAW
jgi:hypothetical protein